MEDSLTMDEDMAAALPAPAAPRRMPRFVPVVAAAVLLLAAIGGGAYYWLRSAPPATAAAHGAAPAAGSYVDAPAIVVNLRGADGRAHFLKLRFVIVASSASSASTITERMPAIIDAMQSFLRELRPEDLTGSAAVFRVKEEMMIRAQDSLGKGMVNDILIQDLVEQ